MTNEEAIAVLRRFQDPEPWEPKINKVGFEALDLALSALSRDRWISVEERLPDTGEDVLALVSGTSSSGSVHYHDAYGLAIYDQDESVWFLDSDPFAEITVTHWMPLPEPPKEET